MNELMDLLAKLNHAKANNTAEVEHYTALYEKCKKDILKGF